MYKVQILNKEQLNYVATFCIQDQLKCSNASVPKILTFPDSELIRSPNKAKCGRNNLAE